MTHPAPDAKTTLWIRRYRRALGLYAGQGTNTRPEAALRLGRQAAALNLETLEVARFHAQAMLDLEAPGPARARAGWFRRTDRFFGETLVPIEMTHRAAREPEARADRQAEVLRRRTREARTSARQLDRSIADRKDAETALRLSKENLVRLLDESLRLQKRLRVRARALLSSQERERKRSRRRLSDELAQGLLAIHIRLLSLKVSARTDIQRLKKDIAGTERLVKKSMKTIQRVSQELRGPDDV